MDLINLAYFCETSSNCVWGEWEQQTLSVAKKGAAARSIHDRHSVLAVSAEENTNGGLPLAAANSSSTGKGFKERAKNLKAH